MRAVLAIVLMMCVVCIPLLCEDSDASYSVTYGSDSVGADKIVFDSNGGTGGYAQYVLNGNEIHVPTEYKMPGLSNTGYTAITRSGYVLTGWENGSAVLHPGQQYTVTNDVTYRAVWTDLAYDCIGRLGGSQSDLDSEAEHIIVPVGEYAFLTVDDDTGAYALMRASADRPMYRYALTVEGNGQELSSITDSRNTSISADWMTLAISSTGEFSLSGTPNCAGIFCIKVDMQTKSLGGSYGDLEDLTCKWYVSVYDDDDASDLMHLTYNGNDIGHGPYHTAVRLPDSVSDRQKGWNLNVDGSPAVFPVGGSYSLVRKEVVITASEYTFDEVTASGVIGVIAYNANGGSYNGAFADLVPSDGYAGLRGGSVVSKQGCTFLGWNVSGLATDTIYPSGYLYDMAGEYTELKAVWVSTVPQAAYVYFENPGDGNQNHYYVLAKGYDFAVPVNGFALTGYDFEGWSSTRYEPGEGTAEIIDSITVFGNATCYAVFTPKTYDCIVHYDANGGIGSMEDELHNVTELPHFIEVMPCLFIYDGHTFVGWAESRYAESTSYNVGDLIRFDGSATITLYAVWTEGAVSNDNVFVITFYGNGPSVTNVPSMVYRSVPVSSMALYIPSTTPMRDGCQFRGWSSSPIGDAEYQPGERIVLTSNEGSTSISLGLYAVWVTVQDGTYHTVTFTAGGGTIRTVSVAGGSTVPGISAPTVEGRAFIGWYLLDTEWDFSHPVTEDMTLVAKYLAVFHLSVAGNDVKIVPDCVASSYCVVFSDGFDWTYSTATILIHGVTEDGNVTVTAVTENGTYTASCHYAVQNAQTDDEQSQGDDYSLPIGIIAALVIITIVFALAWRFLL